MSIKWIAEIGSNHNCSLNRCCEQIDIAYAIGCDAVKFQLFKGELLYHPSFKDKIAMMKEWELPVDFVPDIAYHCKYRNIEFGCTPFYLDAVTILHPYVDFLKIGSYELTWTKLISKCAKTQKPLIISTGMSTISEITRLYYMKLPHSLLRRSNASFLHCVSGYPARASECNMSVIPNLKRIYRLPIGWSDHTVEPGVIYEAVAQGAEIIECHFDMDGKGWEQQAAGHCWLPEQLAEVIDTVKVMEAARGDGVKVPTDREKEQLQWRADPETGMRGVEVK